MTNSEKITLTNFNELNSLIINSVSPTVLAFAKPNSFGQFWLEKMNRQLTQMNILHLTFHFQMTQDADELAILTKEGGGPVLFFIKNRKIVAKSMGRVSEYEFMEKLSSIYSLSQAA